MRFFDFKWFGQKNPSRLLISKIFPIFVSNSPRYSTFRAFRVFSVYVQIRSAYSQYTNRFIPRILITRTDSFRVFSVNEQIHSAYSHYMNRFIPRTLSIRTNSFHVFRECAQIISNIQNWIIFITALKGILLQKKVCICATGPKTCKE